MLSYRHAFHAGNHADVLKHIVLIALIDYLNLKPKPYTYIDMHAGAGLYDLTTGYATKNAEFNNGIIRLMNDIGNAPELIVDYLELIKSFNNYKDNGDNILRFYPGSPLLADKLIREDDDMHLFELHSTDSKILQANCDYMGRSVIIHNADSLSGLRKLLPTRTRRGLVLIDPSYENKNEYVMIPKILTDAIKRFSSGIYALWYPCLPRLEVKNMLDNLKGLQVNSYCHIELCLQTPSDNGLGMYGSGMFIINPPWNLPDTLKYVLPYLSKSLAVDVSAGHKIEYWER